MKEKELYEIESRDSAADKLRLRKWKKQRLFTEDEVNAIVQGRLAKERKMLAKKWKRTSL